MPKMKPSIEVMKLRCLLYEAIVELEYVRCAEDHSLCASAKGKEIIERGMELLGVKDFSAEFLPKEQLEREIDGAVARGREARQ